MRAMNEGKVRATNGQDFSVRAQSVCVHPDTPGAIAVPRRCTGRCDRPGPRSELEAE